MSANINTPVEEKKLQIIKSAKIIFGKYGFSKTTLEDIATHLGMKKNSLYYYFPSKEAIFEEVINHNFKIAMDRLTEATSRESSAAVKLKIVFDVARELAKEDYNQVVSINAIMDIHSTIKDYYKNLNNQSISFLSNIIAGGVKTGEFKKCEPKEIAKALISLYEALKVREFYNSKAKYVNEIDFKESDKTTSLLIDLIIEGLKQKK